MWWWLAGCSLGVTAWTPCESGAECREAFGFGYTCGDEGVCEQVATQARCGDTWPADLLDRPELHGDAVLVGSLFDHSTDVPEAQSARLAVKQVDESEGISGTEVALVQCSYEEDPELDALGAEEAAIAMANWLVDDLGAFAIVGPATSGVTEAVYRGVSAPLIVSPSATSPALTFLDAGDRPAGRAGRLWRTAPPDSLQGAVLAQLLRDELGAGTHLAVLYQIGPYGEGLADVLIDALGSSATVDRLPFENDTQRNSAVSSAAAAGIDAIVFISSDLPDVTAFLLGLAADGDAAETPIFLADASHDAELFTSTAGTDAEALWPNIKGTSPAVPSGDRYEAFKAAYAATYEGDSADDSSYSSYAYDAAWLTVYGAAWALQNDAELSGQTAADGLRHLSDKDGADIETGPVSWNEAQAAFAGGADVDVVGASGELDFDAETEETTGPVEVWGIDTSGGEPEFVVLDTVAP